VDLTEVAVERLGMRHPQATFLQADVGESGLSRRGRVRFHLRDERSCCISLTTPAGAAHFATSLRSSLPAGHLVVIDPVVVHGWWGHSSVRRPIVVHDISGSRTRRWLCWLGTCGHRPWDCAPRREAATAPIRSRRPIPLDERKNPLVAVWAADRARVTLLVVGDGPLRSTVQHAAGANAHVLGRRDDVPCLLDAADVYVSTSYREGLSLSLLEAMAAGLTPIVTDLPENVEAVDEAGLAFAPGTRRAWRTRCDDS